MVTIETCTAAIRLPVVAGKPYEAAFRVAATSGGVYEAFTGLVNIYGGTYNAYTNINIVYNTLTKDALGTYLERRPMKKKTTKKLVLSKETLRSLKEAEKLKLVAGGITMIDHRTRCCPEN